MNPFELYGHQTNPGTLEEGRPWWRRQPGGWIRLDGAEVRRAASVVGHAVTVPGQEDQTVTPNDIAAALAAGELPEGTTLAFVDHRWPAPPPVLRCGQVWASGDGEITILGVARGQEGVVAVVAVPDDTGTPALVPVASESFGALLLVAGPGAPWAPPGWTLEAWIEAAAEVDDEDGARVSECEPLDGSEGDAP